MAEHAAHNRLVAGSSPAGPIWAAILAAVLCREIVNDTDEEGLS